MFRALTLPLTCAVFACAPQTPTLGGLQLDVAANVLSVKSGPRVLLQGLQGRQASVRTARARTEMLYGSWKFTEGTQPWVEGSRFAWDQVTTTKSTGTYRTTDAQAVVTVEATSGQPGVLALRFSAVDPTVNRLSLSFACADTDHFLGFGAQADGIDHRSHTVAVWTSEPGIGKRMVDDEYPEAWMLEGTRHASSWGLPTFLSNRGFIAAAQTDTRSVFELCSVDQKVWRLEAWSNAVTLWLFVDPQPSKALALATGGLLKRPIKPAPVAFAPWNDAIFGSAEVRRVARALRDNDIPSSVLWTEDFRGGTENAMGYRLKEEWDLDPKLYPDAEALSRELAALGLDWHAYFNTFLVDGERIFEEAKRGDHFVKNEAGLPYLFDGVTFKPTGLADLSRPATREWVKGYLRQALDRGFTGWMADFAEWLPHDAVLASGESALEAHNRYAHEWAVINAEVLKERDPNAERLVFFGRSGWFGTNAVTPVVWAGDQRTSFLRDDGLFTVIPMGINLGLAGVSTYGHDIAGYQSGTNPTSTKELFFRWTTLGALSPVMRTHHGIDARKNWNFEKDAETTAHFRRWAKFHVQLFPYLDGASRIAEETGLPLMRGLFLEDPSDPAAWTISDEYLLGPSLLVAPVVDQGATQRTVHLPTGSWVPLDGSALVVGPADVMATAPVTEIPLWLRRGAVIPRLPERVDTLVPAEPPTVDLDDVKNERVLLWAPGGTQTFIERDGTTYLSSLDSAAVISEQDQPLSACASASQRGCVSSVAGRTVVRLAGQGPLKTPTGTLTITGPTRTLDVELIVAR